MKATETQELLGDYVRNGSERAFGELVTRYLDLVYSTALRSADGDTHRAEDIAQTVFLDLARLASRLPKDIMLGGWLHRHTCYVASTIMRGERRRQVREREAVEMRALEDHNDFGLGRLAPVLDAAINELDDEDRKAILLRFYERLDLRSVGQVLGSSENAAQKRVSRALDQLHSILTHRGVTLSAAALSAVLAGEAVTAAPAGLAVSIVSSALAGAAAGAGVSVTLIKLSTLTKAKLGVAAALAMGSVATTLWLQHASQLRLLEENQLLREQLAQQAQVEATSRVVVTSIENAAPTPARRRPAPVTAARQSEPTRVASVAVTLPTESAVSTAPNAPGTALYGTGGRHTRFYAKSGSKIKLEGTSNVHDWQVESSLIGGFLEVGPEFPIEAGQPAKPGKVEARAEPFVMVHSLKSVEADGRPYSDRMDQIMYEHLKVEQSPKITYYLTELALKQAAKDRERPYIFEAKGQLVIAGVTNEITMPVEIMPLSRKRLRISGNAAIKMTDFEINPPAPTISLGLIKTGDDVKLSFDWMVGQTNGTSSSSGR